MNYRDLVRLKGGEDPLREAILLFVTDGIANVKEDGDIWVDRYLMFDPNGKGRQSKNEYGNDGFAEAIKDNVYYLISTFIEDKR